MGGQLPGYGAISNGFRPDLPWTVLQMHALASKLLL